MTSQTDAQPDDLQIQTISVGEGAQHRGIAVRIRPGEGRPIVWLGGFRSDMRATKALALDGRAFGIVASQIDIGNALTELSERMTRGVLQANGTVAPEPMMDATHVADAVRHIAALPLSANVLNMTLMASAMPFVGRG